ncbi:methionine ABC transporter permease [Neisseria sp. Ec49-e6-T10]|uniref:methionine ABC transporter permease n=1 Tax=Neisseria sp. Ec49-e6-T10 TaxID=3140744 RepID=UPI003EC14931
MSLTLADYWQNIWSLRDEIWLSCQQTFVMVTIATVVGIIFGTLLGIWLYLTAKKQIWDNKLINRLVGLPIDFMRAFPFVILMVAIAPFTLILVGARIGPLAASVALSIASIPYFARLVEQSLREVPKGVIEAAQAMGASDWTIIFRVLLVEARAGMVSSITVLIISILSYSAAAGMIGGGGLGDLAIRYGYYRYQTEVMVAIVLLLSVIVIFIQSVGNFLARKLDKR